MPTAVIDSFDLDAHLPSGIRRRLVDNGNGLTVNLLEAGPADGEAPCLLLLHGFPELAFSWRRVMPALAAAGYHVIAPDQRGYGWTTGWTARFEGDLGPFKMLNLVQDQLGLLGALGRDWVTAVIGHDFGAPVAAYCGLVRPDVFPAVVCMSAPFGGPPRLPFGGGTAPTVVAGVAPSIHDDLANLARPRKHYQWYYSTAGADADMRLAPQGLHAFLRAYYHHKSADWAANKPYPLAGWTADELAKLPTYYIMDLDHTMPEAVAPEMPSAAEIAACAWLPDTDLAVYTAAYGANGFQGGLQWYRCATGPAMAQEMRVFSGRTLDVPTMFLAGAADWGVYQKPGDYERMQTAACTDFRGSHLIGGAGHWVQQEQPEAVIAHLDAFLATLPR